MMLLLLWLKALLGIALPEPAFSNSQWKGWSRLCSSSWFRKVDIGLEKQSSHLFWVLGSNSCFGFLKLPNKLPQNSDLKWHLLIYSLFCNLDRTWQDQLISALCQIGCHGSPGEVQVGLEDFLPRWFTSELMLAVVGAWLGLSVRTSILLMWLIWSSHSMVTGFWEGVSPEHTFQGDKTLLSPSFLISHWPKPVAWPRLGSWRGGRRREWHQSWMTSFMVHWWPPK